MTEKELEFCILCAPLSDAIEMLDEGNIEGAKAVLQRIISRVQDVCDREQEKKMPQD